MQATAAIPSSMEERAALDLIFQQIDDKMTFAKKTMPGIIFTPEKLECKRIVDNFQSELIAAADNEPSIRNTIGTTKQALHNLRREIDKKISLAQLTILHFRVQSATQLEKHPEFNLNALEKESTEKQFREIAAEGNIVIKEVEEFFKTHNSERGLRACAENAVNRFSELQSTILKIKTYLQINAFFQETIPQIPEEKRTLAATKVNEIILDVKNKLDIPNPKFVLSHQNATEIIVLATRQLIKITGPSPES